MGLLDDAIREHLELRRLRGADPGLVAREEHEALGPVRGGERVVAEDDDAATRRRAAEDGPSKGDDSAQTSQPDHHQSFSNVGQETAELDMRTVLDGESDDFTLAGPATVGSVVSKSSAEDHPLEQDAPDDSLEWEVPGGDESKAYVEQAEGNRHIVIPDLHGDVASDQQGESVEDVLEETPDFLRDTPEQERLWFEQRPPRDFDFDK